MTQALRILVTGGAGYVGSHVVLTLLDLGHRVYVIDNLRTGHRAALPKEAVFLLGDLNDRTFLDAVLTDGPWHAVMHFASLSLVGESMQSPFTYFMENVGTATLLIDACARHNIKRFVLSSTAALFGTADQKLIDEQTPVIPGSPYGESKFMIERMLYWADRIYGLKSACLRYFNAAGADPLGRAGEDHRPETHLIPLVIDAALNRRKTLTLYGTDYPTPDGTCIRDYIHVSDLAQAHIAVLPLLETKSVVYNIGNGHGYSNLDVIRSVERISGLPVPFEKAPRRAGDPAILVASSERLIKETDWQPRFPELDKIVETAFTWRKAHPNGYETP